MRKHTRAGLRTKKPFIISAPISLGKNLTFTPMPSVPLKQANTDKGCCVLLLGSTMWRNKSEEKMNHGKKEVKANLKGTTELVNTWYQFIMELYFGEAMKYWRIIYFYFLLKCLENIKSS